MRNALATILVAFLCLHASSTEACTGIFAHTDQATLFASSEDGHLANGFIWNSVYEAEYRACFVGFYGTYWGPQGGVNEAGLCFDGFGAPEHDVAPQDLPPYPTPPGYPVEYALIHYATVAEVVDFFESHDRSGMTNGQWMFSDATGNSAIIEADTVIYIEGEYQVCTNFYQSDPSLGAWPCWRYAIADSMLAEADSYDAALFQDILEHVRMDTMTYYSYVVDIRNQAFTIFFRGDYTQSCRIPFDDLFSSFSNPRPLSILNYVGVEEPESSSLPTNLGLSVAPNPFNAQTTIRFEVPLHGQVSVDAFDVTGRLVRRLYDAHAQEAGSMVSFDASDLASGSYFIRLSVGDEQVWKKCVLLR